MDRLSCSVTELTRSIFDRSGCLIQNTLACKVIVARYPPNALFDATHDIVSATSGTRFTAPLPHFIRSVLETVNA